jgi:hypothetical protein
MAGYSGYSKSNNAIRAEDQGKLTLTQFKKTYKLETQTIEAFFKPCEWHHTSSFYNETNYYDPEEIKETFAEFGDAIEKYNADILSKNKQVETYENCEVHYIEWVGSRNYSKAIERTLHNVNITKKGQTYTITDQDGNKLLSKREDTKGFYFITHDELERRNKALKHRANLEQQFYCLMEDKVFSVFNYFDKNNEEQISGNFFIKKLKEIDDHYLERFINTMNEHGRGRFLLEYLIIDPSVEADLKNIPEKLKTNDEISRNNKPNIKI